MNTHPAPSARARALRAFLTACLFVIALPVFAQHGGHHANHASDPRVGLKAGWLDAGEAISNLELVASVPRSAGFYNPEDPGDFSFMNSDLAFAGDTLFLGNFSGVQIYDISDPANPELRVTISCYGGQGDVSVHGNLLFMSVEETRGRLDCGSQGVEGEVSAERFRGVRIFDISDLDNPQQVAAVQSCRGSHTHTLVPDPSDPENLYVYISGTSQVRSGEELEGCVDARPDEDPNTARFRIEVVKVPLARPSEARIINEARFLVGLEAPPTRGVTAAEVMANLGMSAVSADEAAAAEARGAFTVTYNDTTYVMADAMAERILPMVVSQRGGQGAPTAQDSTMLRQFLPMSIQQTLQTNKPSAGGAGRLGPDQCHDITVYPEVGLAGGACSGYGILLDISDPANPTRLDAAGDANFAYWHSATFNNDGTKVIFTDEWGGGTAPRCRDTDRPEWGANAVFTIEDDSLRFHTYYKLPAPQSSLENCVAHNGSLIPIPGRDVMAQAWYQGGLSVFDFTDPENPVEIAYFDRGPMDSTQMAMGGYWSTYWYNGYIYASEIGRGLDVFRLVPSEHLSASEIAAAEAVEEAVVNPQLQTRIVWPATFSVARAYFDQLVREEALDAQQAARIEGELSRVEAMSAGDAQRTAASRLAETIRSMPDATSDDDSRLARLAATLEAIGGQP